MELLKQAGVGAATVDALKLEGRMRCQLPSELPAALKQIVAEVRSRNEPHLGKPLLEAAAIRAAAVSDKDFDEAAELEIKRLVDAPFRLAVSYLYPKDVDQHGDLYVVSLQRIGRIDKTQSGYSFAEETRRMSVQGYTITRYPVWHNDVFRTELRD